MLTEHHILAKSRNGKDQNNIVRLPDHIHVALHTFFGNLTPDEMHKFIDIVLRPNAKWSSGDLEALRQNIMRRR